jgi:anti-anti-sigma factor
MYSGEFRVVDVVLDGSIVVVVEGDLDVASVPTLRLALDQLPSNCRVVLDLSSVLFMDSSGLGLLVRQLASRLDAGGSLHIRNSSAVVRRVVEITGLDALLLEHVPSDLSVRDDVRAGAASTRS